VQDYNSMELC